MNALESQMKEVDAIVNIIIEMFGIEISPSIMLSYNEPTAFSVDYGVIRIKMPFNLCDVLSIQNIAHECYHYVDYTLKPRVDTYSDEDRKIIETECSEYAYKYKFERDATVFMMLFCNYFFKEVVGYNYKELFPSISSIAKDNYPFLIECEKQMVLDYFEKKDIYYKLFDTSKDKMIRCYESFY